jgi:hypothetical protein
MRLIERMKRAVTGKANRVPTMTGTVNIAGLDKAAVLAALVNGTEPLGRGASDPNASKTMSVEDARRLITQVGLNFRTFYAWGRPIKVDLSGDTFEPGAYDRDSRVPAEQLVRDLRG